MSDALAGRAPNVVPPVPPLTQHGAPAAGGAGAQPGAALAWRWSRFAELGVDDLYDALALRCRVFILEQGPYLDPDGVDRSAWHLLGRDAAGAPQAYLRVVDPGVKYAEPSIGRVITAPEVRGSGLGRVLVAEGVARCTAAWPGRPIRISAQARLRRFYEDAGFVAVGAPYIEDTLPHQQMLLRGSNPKEP